MANVEEAKNTAIALLYEAVMAPDRWHGALEALRCVTGSSGTIFNVWDKPKNSFGFMRGTGVFTGELTTQYVGHYARIDPRRALLSQTPGELVNFDEYVDPDFVRHSEFYNDFLVPRGGRHSLAGRLHESARFSTVFEFDRGPRRGHTRPTVSRSSRP